MRLCLNMLIFTHNSGNWLIVKMFIQLCSQLSFPVHGLRTHCYRSATTRTHFADHAFRYTAPTVWNSLNSYTVDSGSLAVFKLRLKTFLYCRTFNQV